MIYLKVTGKRPGEFLFTGHRGPAPSMTTRQYARLVSEWIGSVGLDPRLFGTHSLRRTKATLIYRRTGNLRAVQLLLGHTKIESTVRYLGIEVDDALDHFVGAAKQHRRYRQAERLCRCHVDDQLVLGWCLHWKIGGLRSLEKAINIC